MKKSTMLMLAILMACVFAISGCETTSSTADTHTNTYVQTSCASASAALKVLTEANKAGKLSVETQQQVLDAATILVPVCGSTEPLPADSLAIAALREAVTLLTKKASEVRSP